MTPLTYIGNTDSIGHHSFLAVAAGARLRAREPPPKGIKERMPLGASENDSSRMKGNSHVQFVFWGGEGARQGPLTDLGPGLSESEVVGLPIPTWGMLGFAKSSTLRCL